MFDLSPRRVSWLLANEHLDAVENPFGISLESVRSYLAWRQEAGPVRRAARGITNVGRWALEPILQFWAYW